jgi:hypothetical protein
MSELTPDLMGGRDDDPTQTPDVQAATGMSYGNQGSLISTLGGMQSGPPMEAVLGLLQGPTFGQQLARAAAGGVSSMRGQPNPVSQMINDQQRDQMGIVEMIRRMEHDQRLGRQWGIEQTRLQAGEDRRFRADKARQDHQIQQDKQAHSRFLLDLNEKTLARAKDPTARQHLAEERGKLMAGLTGVPAPPSEIASWALTPEDSKDRRDAIAQAFVAAEDPKTGVANPARIALIAQKFGLTPEDVNYWIGNTKSDAFLAANNIPGRAVLNDRQTQYLLRERELADSALPFEKRKNPEWFSKMEAAASRVLPNRDFASMDPKERAQVYEFAKGQDTLEKIRQHEQISAIDARRQIQVAGAKLDMTREGKAQKTLAESSNIYTNRKGDLPDPTRTEPEAARNGFFQIKSQELTALTNAGMALKQLEMWKEQIKKMKGAGLTSESSGLPGFIGDQLNIGTAKYRGAEQRNLLATFESMKTELINLLRASGDNARAAVLLLPTINAMSPMAGEKGLSSIMSKLEQSLRAGGALSRTPELFSSTPMIFPIDSAVPGIDQDGWGPGVRSK